MLPQLSLDIPAVRNRLTSFLRTEIRDAGLQTAIVGLSGGVDSALVGFLAVEALGAENVRFLMMPYKTSSSESIDHAQLVLSALGGHGEVIDITKAADAVIDTDPDMSRVRRGNIMARLRMIHLYDRSARESGLVVGTGNKTEVLLGYSTQHGDAACAVNPLGNLYKTQVWLLAEAVGVPEVIISKAPSADLWSGQTDEGELGFTYREVDELLYWMTDAGLSREELLARGFEASFIDTVTARIEKNMFKRLPPRIASIQ